MSNAFSLFVIIGTLGSLLVFTLLLVLNRKGYALSTRIILAPGQLLSFSATDQQRIRVFGLRPVSAGQRSESLVRFALGGDLVVRTPVD
jgi:uncharacterized membrane protein YdcZ (DUF606 family)